MGYFYFLPTSVDEKKTKTGETEAYRQVAMKVLISFGEIKKNKHSLSDKSVELSLCEIWLVVLSSYASRQLILLTSVLSFTIMSTQHFLTLSDILHSNTKQFTFIHTRHCIKIYIQRVGVGGALLITCRLLRQPQPARFTCINSHKYKIK